MWEFEPGQFSFNKSVSHTYTRNGTYNVSLTVYDPNCGRESSGSKTIKQINVTEKLHSNISYSPTCGSFPLVVHFFR